MNTYYEADYVTAVPDEVYVILTTLFAILGIISVIVLVGHIIDAIALMKLGKRFNVKNAWLAWIPVGDQYVVGSLAASADESKGRERKWGKILPIWYGIGFIGYIFVIPLFGIYMQMLTNGEQISGELALVWLLCYVFALPGSIALSVAGIFNFVCIYKIFEHLNVKKAVKYFILSILVPLADGILLLKCEKELAEAEEASVNEE